MSTLTPEAAADPAPRRSRGRPRKTEGERDDGNRRLELIRAAARLFRQQGFAATSTRDIAAAVGMRSGSPFYHFDSKETLLAAVMEEGMRSALERQQGVLAAAGPDTTPVLRFRTLVRNHLDVLLGPDSDFIPVMLYEWRSLTPAQREAVVRLKNAYEQPWAELMARLHASGHLKGDIGLARLLMFGALNWSAQWFDPHRGASLDELADAALQLFLKDVP